MNYKQLISQQEIIKKRNYTTGKELNIVYCFDDNYSLGAGVSLISLLENNNDIQVSAHLFVIDMSQKNRERFVHFAKTYPNLALTIYHINEQFDISNDNKKSFPISACLRIIAPEILKDITEQLIYIDCDTLVIGSLLPLINNHKNKIIAAIEDYDAKRHIKRLNLFSSNYFNSGVLLINTNHWCDAKISQKTLELLLTNTFEFPDQDALNIILCHECEYLPQKYNYQTEASLNWYQTSLNKPCVIHYLGQDKPWFSIFTPQEYQRYLNMSPWQNTKLKFAPNARRIRIYSHRLKTTNKIKSLRLYLQYLYYKIVSI